MTENVTLNDRRNAMGSRIKRAVLAAAVVAGLALSAGPALADRAAHDAPAGADTHLFGWNDDAI